MAESKKITSACLLLLLVAAAWTYGSSLANPFHFDDNLFLQSPQVTQPGDPWYLLKPTQTRQLTWLTFYWNYRVGGTSPAGYHLVNLVLHLANVLALYWLCALLVRRTKSALGPLMARWLPLAAAGVFALHPIQSEPVNYVYQRSVLLAGLFTLVSMGSFLQSQLSQRRKAWLAVSAAGFLLAVAAKESALVLPLVCVAFLWVEADGSKDFRRRLAHSPLILVALAVAAAGGAWMLYILQHRNETSGDLITAGRWLPYLFSQLQVLATYLRLLLIPAGLSIDHDFQAASALSIYSWLCILMLAGILLFAVLLRRRLPLASFLILAFLLFLAPTSSIVPRRDLLFEHRLYLPMIAASIFVAWGVLGAVFRVMKNRRGKTATALVCVCLLLASYAVVSRRQTHVWGDNIRLWQAAAAQAPRKPRVRYNLGIAYLDVDRRKARQEFLATLELDAGYAAAWYNLGWLAQTERNYDEARRLYGRAIQADPGTWQAYHNLGNIDILQGNYRAAQEEFAETIRLRRDYWPAHLNLALAQLQTGNTTAALQTLQDLKRWRWDLLEARYLNAYVLVREGRFKEAESDLQFLTDHDSGGAYSSRAAELRGRIPSRQ